MNSLRDYDSRPPSDRAVRVLVAEDNSANQIVLTEFLRPLGYHVELADNGREALQMLRDEEFDVVLMDLQMPEMDGYEATRAIRELRPPRSQIPVIAITSLTRNNEREACFTAGIDDYLAKPVDKEQLLSRIESWTRNSAQDKTARPRNEGTMMAPSDSDVAAGDERPAPVINLEVSLARMGNDKSLLTQLAEFFLEDAPQLLAEMRDGQACQDAKRVHRAVHSLKGMAANFEALPAVAAAKLVEEQSRRNDPVDLARLVSSLETEISKVTDALITELLPDRSRR